MTIPDPPDTETEEVEDLEEETEEDEDDLEQFKEFTQEDVKKLMGKLSKTRREAKNLRAANKRLREGEEELDEETKKERSKAAELSKWQQRAIRSGAKAALIEKGVDSELLDLAIGKIKYEDIEFDDDDEPIFDEWLEEMEERYPKLFTQQVPKRKVPSVNQGAATQEKKEKKISYGEQVINAGRRVQGVRQPRARR